MCHVDYGKWKASRQFAKRQTGRKNCNPWNQNHNFSAFIATLILANRGLWLLVVVVLKQNRETQSQRLFTVVHEF